MAIPHEISRNIQFMIFRLLKERTDDSVAHRLQESFIAAVYRSVLIEEDVKIFMAKMDTAGSVCSF